MKYTMPNWNNIWKDMKSKNMQYYHSGEKDSIWESKEKARSFLKESRENPERIHYVLEGLPINPGSRVIDIGAGPGTLAVPLAGMVYQVLAVEPAEGMAEVMEEYAIEEGVRNISILKERWEDINPAKDLNGDYDIVVASYSLGMPDIRAAIETMCEASSKWVYLFWFSGTSGWEEMMTYLWPKIHGKEYCHGPKADVLFNVLYSMGICPNVETKRTEYSRRFKNIQAAVNEYKGNFKIETKEQERILQDYLNSKLKENNGEFLFTQKTTRVKIWWNVNEREDTIVEDFNKTILPEVL